MNVEELIIKLEEVKNNGYGKLKVKFDFGACEVKRVYIDDCCGEEYVHLDWD